MSVLRHLAPVSAAFALASGNALAQLNLPRIVQLPTEDFVWTWGDPPSVDNGERPDFDMPGVESNFRCQLTGMFKPGSHMTDFDQLRNFEQSLGATIYFIEDATYALNDLYQTNDLKWAVLNCMIPDAPVSDDKQQERIDKAVERAERARERRREREAEDADN